MTNCYVSLAGGLGNQLFQIAAGYAYSRRNNKHLVLEADDWTASQGNSPIAYKNTVFKNFKYFKNPNTYPRIYQTITEDQFNYREIPKLKGDVKLSGYFQSIKHFEDYKDEFISLLSLPEVKSSWIHPKNVAVHIRRGDYIQHQHIHLVCGTEYFKNAFKEFDGYQINVFTDSPEFVQREFSGHNFNIIQGKNDAEELTLMSLHDNIVCSNSSFSWWASLLSKKKDKILVPEIWFKNFEEHGDIYRDEFSRRSI